MQGFFGDSDPLQRIGYSAGMAIQSGIELAIVQNLPVTSAHILFGIFSIEDTAAHELLERYGITAEAILDSIPQYYPDENPPF